MTTITHVHAVAVIVDDQDRALQFYTDTLGLEVRLDAPLDAEFRWIEVAPPGAATGIALVRPDGQGTTAAGGDTGIRLAVADATATHEQLRSAGAAVGELLIWDDVPPMFTLEDPDGNRLYVVELPGDAG